MSALILVVDDEPDVAELFRQQFRRELRASRFVMEFAQSAPEALERVGAAESARLILIGTGGLLPRYATIVQRSLGVHEIMAESGGATTQDGIFYQNTVAARHLADLLELGPLPPRERVVEVRVEAPSDVDDVVVRFADGHRDWIQAKLRIQTSGDAWHAYGLTWPLKRQAPSSDPKTGSL